MIHTVESPDSTNPDSWSPDSCDQKLVSFISHIELLSIYVKVCKILKDINLFLHSKLIVGVLVPDNVEDETAGCIHFHDEFTNRYGALHPDFFQGTLEDAIKEACQKPAKEVNIASISRNISVATLPIVVYYLLFFIFEMVQVLIFFLLFLEKTSCCLLTP